MRYPRRFTLPVLTGAASLLLAACASGPVHHATSVVNYLYPDRRDPVEKPSVPTLELPLRVGIAFVPFEGTGCATCERDAFPEAERVKLLNRVAEHFKDSAFVKSIEVIPTDYLTPRGSFTNLDQLRRMFDIDVIALVSYDQIQFDDPNRLSLTYWTVVGAYLVSGDRNDTRTLMDAVVYDIPSRKLLFRAPGASTVKGSSAAVNVDTRLRADREKGFQLASDELVANLDKQLVVFREKVRSTPAEYHVVQTPEYRGGTRGGGSADGWTLLIVGALGAASIAARRRARR